MPRPVSASLRASDIEPTMVTSRPSRIQTVPSPTTIIQWNFDHGNRSSRAGMSVVMVPVCTPDMAYLSPAALPSEGPFRPCPKTAGVGLTLKGVARPVHYTRPGLALVQ